MAVDLSITAIGQWPDLAAFTEKDRPKLTRWNTLVVDSTTLETSIPGVFAGGDVVSGPVKKDVTIHDSCVYARHEGIVEEPRELLRRAGYTIHEPKDTKDLTHCCGGPIESIFPKMAHQIGGKRVQQLKNANGQGVATMCPICMATLQKASNGKLEIDDISGFLVKAYCSGEDDERSEP